MKKHKFRYIALGMVMALMLSSTVNVFALNGSRTLKAIYNDIKITLNGKDIVTEKEPFIVDGTTYLPVRDVGEALGLDVEWNSKTKTVELSDKAYVKEEVKEFIGETKAKEIAFDHAGVKENDVKFLKVKFERDDGRYVYDIDFYKGYVEYDYEINAESGKIISYDNDIEDDLFEAERIEKTAEGIISREEAIEKALEKAGGNAVLVKIELDRDDGRIVYEGELRDGRIEYDFEINAETGKIVKWEKDYDD